jgi:5-methylcytosine-specific restriction endonuclease McrA
LGQPINLEVHHIDGDRTNNSLENLQLLCPNCHSYTTNFRKPKNKTIIPEE